MSNKKFTPPLFGKFAKNVKDLFKKKYEFDHTVKLINKSAGGVTVESGVVTADGSSVKGYLKGKYAKAEWGESEVEAWTSESNESKANLKLTKLADGVNVTLTHSLKDKDNDFKKSVSSVDVEYTANNVATQHVLKTDLQIVKLESTLAVGSDGISLAAQAVTNFTQGADVVDYNVAAEYTQSDLSTSIYTEKKASIVNAAIYQKPNNNQVVGAIFKYDLNKHVRSLTIGGEHRVDADTTVRGKAELPSGDVSLVVEHRLNNPSLLLQVASQFATKPTLTSQKLGVAVSLGDF